MPLLDVIQSGSFTQNFVAKHSKAKLTNCDATMISERVLEATLVDLKRDPGELTGWTVAFCGIE